MTRLAFIADVHADVYGSRIDPESGLNARLVDHIRTLRFVAEDAVARGCDALITAGDLTERRHVPTWLAGLIADAYLAGPERQIFTRGNHDGAVGGESIITVLGRMQPTWDAFVRPGVTTVGDVAIACIPHIDGRWLRAQPGFESVPPDQINQALAAQYLVIAGGLFVTARETGLPNAILVVHQGLSGGAMSAAQAAFLGDKSLVVDSAALAAQGWDAVIAGHFHKAQELSTDPLVAYTGSIERNDFAEEHDDKSYLILAAPAAGPITWERIPTPARRYVTLHSLDPVEAGDVDVNGAMVRYLGATPDDDPALLRSALESYGTFEVTEIRRAPVEAQVATTGLSETLAPAELLSAYFAEHPDREALVERGREILEAVGS